MDFLKQNKVPLLAGVMLLLAIYAYMTYFGGSSSALLTSSDTNVTLSQNILVTLQNLHTIKLDNSIFSNPAFQSLTDFGVVIPPEQVGRRNPFVPITTFGTPAGSTGASNAVKVPLPKTTK